MANIKIAIVGYGNIGKGVLEAVSAAPDMELVGVVRRSAQNNPPELTGIEVVEDIAKLGTKPDVAILCTPTRSVPEFAEKCLSMGISTVDSYDIHTGIWELKERLEPLCKEHGAVSIISAGWDPGSDSMVRAILEACAPKGITYTNFGPGMSMGHTVAVKAIDGVKGALSLTIPVGTGIHRRMVYVEVESGYKFEEVAAAIKADPYFVHDETHVIETDNVDALIDKGHGVNLVRTGVSGTTNSQRFEFNMSIDNPALTAQVMVSSARAATRKAPGCYTLIEVAPAELLPGSLEDLVRRLV